MEKRRPTAPGARGKSRRRRTLLIIAAVVAVVIGLLIWEQVALLYVLSTLGVVALLVIVAFADLGQSRRPSTQPAPFDDAAAVASGITPQNVSAAKSGDAWGATKSRRKA
ncbi:MAG TPA: hypothetical protein VFX96_19470 [Pyrinomonadaceae bacterium]|nr:hypothetical protein [Pyrinomonadaceae bacterium]